jgi:hypothetical protein
VTDPGRRRRPKPTRRTALACLAGLTMVACSSGEESAEPTSPEDAENAMRLRVDGLTLVYPTDVFDGADVAEPGAQGAALTVDFEMEADTAAGRMTVVVVRTATGEEVAGLSAEDRARLVEMEGLDAEGDDGGDVLEFVNGAGLRILDDGYRFDGLTNDERFLVGFTASVDAQDRLDSMIGTVFVDGASEVYGTEECEDDVELITENGLADGATVAPGEEVTATWQIRNVGTCTWGPGYSWVFTGGEPVTIVSTGGVADVGPGESTEVVAVFVAPGEPGRYAAQWQLQSPADLEPLGTPAFVLFVVES